MRIITLTLLALGEALALPNEAWYWLTRTSVIFLVCGETILPRRTRACSLTPVLSVNEY